MNNNISKMAIVSLLLFSHMAYGQSKKELAATKTREAIQLEDKEGKYDEAISLREEAQTKTTLLFWLNLTATDSRYFRSGNTPKLLTCF